MNIGKARDPNVAIGLLPKNLVMLEGSFDKASRCMAFRNFLEDKKWEGRDLQIDTSIRNLYL